jgi:hypothetical protein
MMQAVGKQFNLRLLMKWLMYMNQPNAVFPQVHFERQLSMWHMYFNVSMLSCSTFLLFLKFLRPTLNHPMRGWGCHAQSQAPRPELPTPHGQKSVCRFTCKWGSSFKGLNPWNIVLPIRNVRSWVSWTASFSQLIMVHLERVMENQTVAPFAALKNHSECWENHARKHQQTYIVIICCFNNHYFIRPIPKIYLTWI